MTTNVENLVTLLTTDGDNSADDAIMRRIITRLDAIEDGFSEDAAKVINDSALIVRQTLRMWVTADYRIDAAVSVASSVSNASKQVYSAGRYILDDAVITGSLNAYFTVRSGIHDVSAVRAAHQLMLLHARHLVPDLRTAAKHDVDSYCLPLGAAAFLLRTRLNAHLAVPMPLFEDKAIPFIAWVAEQDDVDLAVTTAIRVGSLDPESIAEFNAALKSTHGSLNTGML